MLSVFWCIDTHEILNKLRTKIVQQQQQQQLLYKWVDMEGLEFVYVLYASRRQAIRIQKITDINGKRWWCSEVIIITLHPIPMSYAMHFHDTKIINLYIFSLHPCAIKSMQRIQIYIIPVRNTFVPFPSHQFRNFIL